uniref:Uncharacterized protein n=1 Tax=Anguilla anguilla TaxID=7936 RepID=A0A0E9R1X5_ANGAN
MPCGFRTVTQARGMLCANLRTKSDL